MSNESRKEGYYWVIIQGNKKHTIAFWNDMNNEWEHHKNPHCKDDSDFSYISPTPIDMEQIEPRCCNPQVHGGILSPDCCHNYKMEHPVQVPSVEEIKGLMIDNYGVLEQLEIDSEQYTIANTVYEICSKVCIDLLRTRTSTVGVSDEEIENISAAFTNKCCKSLSYSARWTEREIKVLVATAFIDGYKQSIADRAGYTESDVLAFVEWIQDKSYSFSSIERKWENDYHNPQDAHMTQYHTTAQLFSAYPKKNNG